MNANREFAQSRLLNKQKYFEGHLIFLWHFEVYILETRATGDASLHVKTEQDLKEWYKPTNQLMISIKQEN